MRSTVILVLMAAAAAQSLERAGGVSSVRAGEPVAGQAMVEESNTVLDPQSRLLQVFFRLDAAGLDKDGKELPIAAGLGAAGDLLRQWQQDGTAAGNRGDLYDNRDRDHSTMTVASFPQLTRVEYAPALKQRGLDYGPQIGLLFQGPDPKATPEPEDTPDAGKATPAEADTRRDGITQLVTIGNSSTAWVGQPTWRSQYRGLLTRPGGGNLKMVRLAHGIESTSLPPLCILHLVEEDEAVVGRDYFDVAPRERLLDTPAAIARIVKSSKYERRMVVSAERSRDLHDKPLTFHWVVLRGGSQGRLPRPPACASGQPARIESG